MTRLENAAPWLRLSQQQRDACVSSDDCLDALICALVARAAAVGVTTPPTEEQQAEAESEGWIHLPTDGALKLLPEQTHGMG